MFHSRTLRRALAVAGAIAISAAAADTASAQRRGGDRDSGRTFYAATSKNLLIQFNERRVNRITDVVALDGLPSGVRLVGIDFRPKTGDLFGIGTNSVVYRISPYTGIAIAENRDAMGNPVPFTPALNGNSFGFDFNPVPDAIRLVSDAEQNLRLSPDGGNVVSVDGTINGGAADPNIVGAAYENSSFSFAQPAATTLHVVDSNTDMLYVQNPPNNGTLTMPKRLGVDVGNQAGFDIAGDNNTGYLATRRPGGSSARLYRVNVANGRTQSLGVIGNGRYTVTGLAAWQDQGN